ncbi:MAG TPA: tetratricopeptide repeat protein [Allosphingosinicella sp.]|nr:tetratricopeptide repeat protein [Allosphingosinicella sp.]
MARRRTKKRETRSAAATAAAIAVTVGAAALMALVARNAAIDAGRLPAPAEKLNMRLALAAAARPVPALPDGPLAAARGGAAAEPLAWEPFFVAGRAAEQAGRYQDAMRLMEEARRRRPSYSPARLLLMGYYARFARYDEALAEADAAMRLSSQARIAIVPVLADMIRYPGARPGLAAALAEDPVWREAFVAAARDKARPEDVAALLAELRRRRPAHGAGLEAALLVQTLVRSGRFAEGRAEWLKLVPPAERARAGLVFDGDFVGARAPAPFNWSFASGEGGRAEIARAGGGEPAHLSVSYFGAQAAMLAEQTLVLTPGRYLLSVGVKGDRQQLSGEISWRVRCLPAGPELGALRLQQFRPAYVGERLAFAVPAGCSAQKLVLAGAPGDLAQPVNVDFAQMRLVRQ